MAAAKKKGLPEYSVSAEDHPMLKGLIQNVLSIRSNIADLTTQETEAKKEISDKAVQIRNTEETRSGNFIGLIRITDPSITPVQVQFKLTGGALDLEEGPKLDELFKTARPQLFEKDAVVTGMIDPDALLQEFRTKNQNPWDFLELTVKKNYHTLVATSAHVTKEEAYLPQKDFLTTLNDVKHIFSDEAIAYIKTYLVQVLKPTVDLGRK